jgi:imidazolonepropionase-like amidohydrolase
LGSVARRGFSEEGPTVEEALKTHTLNAAEALSKRLEWGILK